MLCAKDVMYIANKIGAAAHLNIQQPLDPSRRQRVVGKKVVTGTEGWVKLNYI